MELIDLYIDENLEDNSGVNGIATVDSPAIEQGYFAFNKTKKTLRLTLGTNKGNFAPISADKQILAGALMIPDMEIYRNDNGKEYNCRFTKDTIQKIVKKFSILGYNNSINEMHDLSKPINNSVLYQHFIIDRAMGINPPLNQNHLPDGTWFGFVYVGDKKVWEDFIKTGIYTGFSVEGNFYEQTVSELSEDEAKAIIDAI
jgi:hypothetical protein